MRQLILIATLCGLMVGRSEADAAGDVVTAKLTDSKENYEKVVNKARSALLNSLRKKEDSAQKIGDLQTLEILKLETQVFEKEGKLPTSVSVSRYVHQMRAANARLRVSYEEAIKQYTKAGGIEQARSVQKQLEVLEKSEASFAEMPVDVFQVDTVWIGENPRKSLTVMERNGEAFAANLQIGDRTERVVSGTIKDDKLSWLAKDVRPIRGGPGGDNHGTLGTDEVGEKIDIVWRDPNGMTGTFILRLSTQESNGETK